MRTSYTLAGLAILALAGTASAQSNSAAPASSNGSQSTTSAGNMSVRQQIQNSLGQDGFTNISVLPSSFFIHATNKKGQPVAMVVTPDSTTEVTELGQTGGSQSTGSSSMSKQGSSTQQ